MWIVPVPMNGVSDIGPTPHSIDYRVPSAPPPAPAASTMCTADDLTAADLRLQEV
jgi:hypothetical protein